MGNEMKDVVSEISRFRAARAPRPTTEIAIIDRDYAQRAAVESQELRSLMDNILVTINSWGEHNANETKRFANAVQSIELPTQDLSPILGAVRSLTPIVSKIDELSARIAKLEEREPSPKEWRFEIRRSAGGGIKEVVATAK